MSSPTPLPLMQGFSAAVVPAMPDSDNGYLVVFTSTANRAIPLENALVTVSTIQPDGTSELLYVTRTNQSGRTARLSLPAPPRHNSLIPGSDAAYARYTVSVDLYGYQPVTDRDIFVFSDIVATLPISLIPLELPPADFAASPPMAAHSFDPKE